jgi:hypothetical protein
LAQLPTARTSENQLLCCKSIDKLIAEADEPGHRLKKTLGPWSLTALGIGAIIGSGIFVLTGTAAAGENFAAPSILHAQVLDLISNFLRTGSASKKGRQKNYHDNAGKRRPTEFEYVHVLRTRLTSIGRNALAKRVVQGGHPCLLV